MSPTVGFRPRNRTAAASLFGAAFTQHFAWHSTLNSPQLISARVCVQILPEQQFKLEGRLRGVGPKC